MSGRSFTGQGSHRWRGLLLAAVTLLAVAGIASASFAGPRAPVAVAPAAVLPQGAVDAGAVTSTATITGAVVLKPRDPAALRSFVAAVTSRNSRQFGQYLRPGEFVKRFGPSTATLTAVRAQLRSEGLHLTGTSGNGMMIRFSAPASVVQRAFATRLRRVRMADGQTRRATATAIHVPAAIAPAVMTVLGLDNLASAHPVDLMQPVRSQLAKHVAAKASTFPHPAGSPIPCHAATAAANHFGGLTDDQIANTYGAFGLYGAGDFGAGQHIALYENEPFARSDIKTFDSCYFGAKRAAAMIARLHVYRVDGGQPTGPGEGEALLDVEDVSAMATDATIDVYEGPFTGANSAAYDSLDEYTAIVDADRDPIVSSSWGLCEQTIENGQTGLQQAENILFEQAAAQGQTVFAAAGDNGEDDCNTNETPNVAPGQNPVSVDDPGSQPYVVSVGGTAISDASSTSSAEHVWNDGAVGGAGGGGISQAWEMPSWQRNATVPGIALPGSGAYRNAAAVEHAYGYPTNFCQGTVPGANSNTPCRLVPDVSAQADEYTGAVTVYTASESGGWATSGGTSSATPIWAAMLADVNASRTCTASTTTAHGVGFASPLLYALASNPSQYAASFHDITVGNNDLYDLRNGSVFPATRGYDLASGLGTPRLTGPRGAAGLAYYLCASASTGTRPTVTSLSPASGSVGGGETVTISGREFMTGTTDKVAGVQVGTLPLPAASIDVVNATTIRVVMPAASSTLPPSAPAPQDGSGPANVVVSLRDGASSATTASSRFDYVDEQAGPVPSVSAVSPTGGLRSTPSAVTLLGSGFTGATGVTFGGVEATSVKVDSDSMITATPPPYSASTQCSQLPSGGAYTGENAANDICQAQVQVQSLDGDSTVAAIPVPYEGAFATDAGGVTVLPPGCGCEGVPAPDEYDYLPKPVVTSVSTSQGPGSLADEHGTTLITIYGRGFSPLAIDWADFGNPAQEASIDTNYAFVSGTEIQILAPAQAATVNQSKIALSVRTLAGQSAPATATYAGVPRITAVTNTGNGRRLNGLAGAPDTGGAPIAIAGSGFAGQLTGPVQFTDARHGSSSGTQYTYKVLSDGKLSTATPQLNPGLDRIRLCTVSGCSKAVKADRLWMYPPGTPHVASLTPSSGAAHGGTAATVTGANLGCALQVFFGARAARSFAQPPTSYLDCGTSNEVKATSPAGRVGSKVPVRVETVESYFSGRGRGTTAAKFRYTK